VGVPPENDTSTAQNPAAGLEAAPIWFQTTLVNVMSVVTNRP